MDNSHTLPWAGHILCCMTPTGITARHGVPEHGNMFWCTLLAPVDGVSKRVLQPVISTRLFDDESHAAMPHLIGEAQKKAEQHHGTGTEY